MCLTKTHRLPKISRKPIQVYKVFEHSITNDMLVTPYQLRCYKVGETIKAKHSWFRSIFKNKIEGEGVHAFTTNDFAFRIAGNYINHYVHLCKIPPFTPYWIGMHNDIAASKMIIKEKVEV